MWLRKRNIYLSIRQHTWKHMILLLNNRNKAIAINGKVSIHNLNLITSTQNLKYIKSKLTHRSKLTLR
jgi:hypothetical protein